MVCSFCLVAPANIKHGVRNTSLNLKYDLDMRFSHSSEGTESVLLCDAAMKESAQQNFNFHQEFARMLRVIILRRWRDFEIFLRARFYLKDSFLKRREKIISPPPYGPGP
jgi:hypothetical protein